MADEGKRIYSVAHRYDMLRHIYEFNYISWKEASEKGYPKIMDRATYFVMVDESCGEHKHLVGYTTATEIEECVYMVGNTFVDYDWRGMGYHRQLLKWRNDTLKKWGGTVIYAPLNPQGGTSVEQLRKVVKSLGYEKITYNDMKKDGLRLKARLQMRFSSLEVWRKKL